MRFSLLMGIIAVLMLGGGIFAETQLDSVNIPALRRAIENLSTTFPEGYPNGAAYLKQLEAFEAKLPEFREKLKANDAQAVSELEVLNALRREALLANPLLDFEQVLCVRRVDPLSTAASDKGNRLGLATNFQGQKVSKGRYESEIALFSPKNDAGAITTLYKPDEKQFIGLIDLHFDADKLLFSAPGDNVRTSQIWEIGIDGSGLRQVTKGLYPDVANYDSCYLPDGGIMFTSTRSFQAVPCQMSSHVSNLFRMDSQGRNVRQLAFDQDHSWNPTVMNDGRIMFLRWEYSDTPHFFSRLMFQMNPDGTNQVSLYGSNSYWPNAMFHPQPVPNHPSRFVAIVSGHHSPSRMGELVIFDPAQGRHEADGVVQRIPGYGKKVVPRVYDNFNPWPRFMNPTPLNENYYIVSCRPNPKTPWGIYLVDTFDNMLLLKEEVGYALLEPVPLKRRPTPPVIAPRVNLESDEATVFLMDIYHGPGLEGVPRGTVKKMRVVEPHFAYRGLAGHMLVGIDGPWDVKRIHGTVPVQPDGSAMFTVPANTPLFVQPLDEEGKALQMFRSWFTAMPGEQVSCVGCHEKQNEAPPTIQTMASSKPATPITPWYGPARGFSFEREVQPVLDQYCVGCHNGDTAGERKSRFYRTPQMRGGGKGRIYFDSTDKPDFSRREHKLEEYGVAVYKGYWQGMYPSYVELMPYVRRNGAEGDYHLNEPLAYHADTSELIQMLKKGHHGVQLDREAWERLYTWIDLNVPCHGTWTEIIDQFLYEVPGKLVNPEIEQDEMLRRVAMRTVYANRGENLETIPEISTKIAAFIQPEPVPEITEQTPKVNGWPVTPGMARKVQRKTGLEQHLELDLGGGVSMKMTPVPAGEFVMGTNEGYIDEAPAHRAEVKESFYMGTFEVTNAQYRRFDSEHNSGVIRLYNKDQVSRGINANGDDQPVIRISWDESQAFIAWLSETTGRACSLPTETQWEWACRAGTQTPLSYGSLDADFAQYANLADRSIGTLARRDSPVWQPRVEGVNDKATTGTRVGSYQPNVWGLYDMHGNVGEWTASSNTLYDGSTAHIGNATHKVVRGGSWCARPKHATSSYRLGYPAWQRVHNVGLRVVVKPREN